MELADLIDPAHTAVVTQEMQNGVVGARAIFPALAEEARAAGMIGAAARIVRAARAVGVPVVHCVALRRADGAGSSTNARIFAAARRSDVILEPGSEAAAVVPDVWDEADLVSSRYHGVGPMTGTDVDALLRALGARTVLAVGVSVNVGLTNLVMEAVNRGYQVVVARDAVCGIPRDYADAVLDNTLSLLATLTTADDVAATWKVP